MYEVKMPQMGQSVEEASIVMWFKKEGDPVNAGEPLFSIQTDKAEVECESPASGILRKILLEPDVMVPVLTVVALIGEADEPLPDEGGGRRAEGKGTPGPSVSLPTSGVTSLQPVVPQPHPPSPNPKAASPRAKALAAERGVDLGGVTGTGAGGRIMADDVLAAAVDVKASPTARRLAANMGVNLASVEGTGIAGKIMKADVTAAASQPKATPIAPTPSPGGRRVPLSNMRRIIAKRMCESKFAAPHYYVTVEIDMAAAKAFRASLKAFSASFNDLVLFATVKTLREFPNVNAKWLGDAIEEVADINLGVAVAVPTGLIVPVLKQAQNLSLEGLASACKALIEKARNGKLLPDDYIGNTFTVSNLGPFGVDDFTAIINQPDSAILAVGAMKDRVVAIDGGIHIRPIMKITMSSDHRVVDGAVAAQFMKRLKEILETADF
ncbi:MAG TPA: dihydrolipoamide acetyltransferase family protein [Candidatus Hydrogenedentes bacterium]|nr:dihydrolipoamide acetyltransferase family protein [Candidatus Hydrogenedentota bacterium]